jgi:hypothetical protein
MGEFMNQRDRKKIGAKTFYEIKREYKMSKQRIAIIVALITVVIVSGVVAVSLLTRENSQSGDNSQKAAPPVFAEANSRFYEIVDDQLIVSGHPYKIDEIKNAGGWDYLMRVHEVNGKKAPKIDHMTDVEIINYLQNIDVKSTVHQLTEEEIQNILGDYVTEIGTGIDVGIAKK